MTHEMCCQIIILVRVEPLKAVFTPLSLSTLANNIAPIIVIQWNFVLQKVCFVGCIVRVAQVYEF